MRAAHVCGFCGRETSSLHRCRLCGGNYCEEHARPQAHNCVMYGRHRRRPSGPPPEAGFGVPSEAEPEEDVERYIEELRERIKGEGLRGVSPPPRPRGHTNALLLMGENTIMEGAQGLRDEEERGNLIEALVKGMDVETLRRWKRAIDSRLERERNLKIK